MELLQERIRREGRVLPGNIVKVDGFLNHRVDTRLLEDIADEFAKYFDTSKITVVLTAEASGIALATICAQKYGVPMLFAKKAKSDNIESGLYQSEVFSYTYKKKVAERGRPRAHHRRLHGKRLRRAGPCRYRQRGGREARRHRHRRGKGLPGRR